MKYVCKICGFIYDEDKENVMFSDLPSDWVCPLCKASRDAFEPQTQVLEKEVVNDLPKHEFKELSYGELSAVCSNLARGCEKQYKNEEMEMFLTLADYFASLSAANDGNRQELMEAVKRNLEEDYKVMSQVAASHQDRGTLRACVWGEKVTRILDSLLSRYQSEGEAMLQGTNVWVCSVCGFIYVGDYAPDLCPVCKVPDWKFEKIGGTL